MYGEIVNITQVVAQAGETMCAMPSLGTVPRRMSRDGVKQYTASDILGIALSK